jgi:hypothetical protein
MSNTQTAEGLQLFEWEALALSLQFLSLLEPALVTTTMRVTMVSRPVVPTRLVTDGYRLLLYRLPLKRQRPGQTPQIGPGDARCSVRSRG